MKNTKEVKTTKVTKSNEIERIVRNGEFSYFEGTTLIALSNLSVSRKVRTKELESISLLINEEIAKLYIPPKIIKKVVKPNLKKALCNKPKINKNFLQTFKPSEELSVVIGDSITTRTDAVSKIWQYIKKHNLQNPKNKRNIVADDLLMPLFKKKEISMFELAQLMGKHLTEVK